MPEQPTIYTIGHSNRSADEFIRLLKKFGVDIVADIRRFPTSKFEHFRKENLEKILHENGIEYIWFEGLGGYRKKLMVVSPNKSIRSEGFRNYADYMLTDRFRNEIERLASTARKNKTCIMCAERFFWRCHRMLISDYLYAVLGFEVVHIIDSENAKRHRISRHARPADRGLIYDVE